MAQDIANFNRKLDEAIQQTMETEVFFAAQVAILNAVESEVYQAYNWPYPPSDKPEHYERRYEKGGLADPSNIELVSSGPTGDGWEIEVQNRTRDDISQRLIAPVVETGQGYEWEDTGRSSRARSTKRRRRSSQMKKTRIFLWTDRSHED